MTHRSSKTLPPFSQYLGFQIDEWDYDRVVISCTLLPEHLNNQDVPHGGFVTSLIDTAGSFCGLYCPEPNRRRKALTLSLNCNFTGRALTSELKAIGKVTSSGRNIFHSCVEVYDSEETLIATGQVTMYYRNGYVTVED